MKRKSFIVILVIQFIVILLMLVYAYIQKGLAENAQKEALANAMRATMASEEAHRQMQIAVYEKQESDRLRVQIAALEEQLKRKK